MRTCHIDQTQVPKGEWCPTCLENFKNRRNASTMSWADRQQELMLLYGPLEMPFDNVHQRFEELMGRPVWTHEMANKERMLEEVASHDHPTRQEIIDQIPPEKRLVIETD